MLRGLRNLILEEELPTAAAAQTGKAAVNAAPPPSTVPVAAVPTSGNVRSEMLNAIRQQVFDKLPTAYTKLRDMADKMKTAIPDETTRFRAAIPATGVTLTDINAAMTQHTQALHAVRTQFSAESSRQRDNKVVAKESRRTAIATQVSDLEQQLNTLRTEDAKLGSEIAAQKAQLAQTEADFATTLGAVES